jgi:hypothetical protein
MVSRGRRRRASRVAEEAQVGELRPSGLEDHARRRVDLQPPGALLDVAERDA